MKRFFLGTVFAACVLTGSAFANDYNPYHPHGYRYGSERLDDQMDQLQRDIDRMPKTGHMTPDGSGGYYYTY